MNAPIKTLSTGAGGVDLPPSVSPTRPVAVCSDGSHATFGDLRSLLGEGESLRIRRDPARKTWLVSLLDVDDVVLDYGEADDIEEAAAQLVATLEAVALTERLVADTERVLSADRDNREPEAAQ